MTAHATADAAKCQVQEVASNHVDRTYEYAMPNLEITPNAQQQDSATSHYLDEAGVGVLGDDDEQARALGDVVRVGGGLQVAARPVAGRAPAARLKA